jgi:hypothetical protein
VTGRTLSCLLALLIAPALLHSQRDLATGARASGREALTGAPVHNILIQPNRAIPGPSGLRRLAQHAGTIFSGTVMSVEPGEVFSPGEIPAVAVTFNVEHAIRGATTAPNFTIREWRGLWNGAPRYLPGQRLLLFLYPSSRLGLTSTVGGPLGRFRMDSSGHVLLNAQQAAAFASPPSPKPATNLALAEFIRAVVDSGSEARP